MGQSVNEPSISKTFKREKSFRDCRQFHDSVHAIIIIFLVCPEKGIKMKTFSVILLIFGLASCAFCQYGIPDDDDEPLPARSFSSVLATQAPARLEIVREEPLYSAPLKLATPSLQHHFQPIRITIEKESSQYESSPALFVRSTEAPLTTYTQLEKVLVKENLPSYNAPSVVRVQDAGYSSLSAYDNGLRKEVIPIVKYVMENDHSGSFTLETVSGDGTTNMKNGQLKNLGDKEGPVQVMTGSYSFSGDDGKTYKVDWRADENGFEAVGDHLPVPPS